MAAGQKISRKVKVTQCSRCTMANKAAIERHESPGCKVFKKTGKYAQIRNGICVDGPGIKAVTNDK